MSAHSYSRCWIHLIWGTLDRAKVLNKAAAKRVSRYLDDYAESKEEHHRVRTFAEELKEFIDRHGLHWKDEVSR